MSAKRYTEKFKVEAVKQFTERGHAVYDVASRKGGPPPTCMQGAKSTARAHSTLFTWTTSKPRSNGFELNENTPTRAASTPAVSGGPF